MSLIRQRQVQEKGRFKSGFLLAIFGAVLYSTKAIFVKTREKEAKKKTHLQKQIHLNSIS